MQQDVKSSSISSYMLKTPSLLAQGFNKNKKAQENIFNHMCNFEARVEWGDGSSAIRSSLGVDIRNDKYCLVNPTPLDCIIGYIMEDAIGDRSFKRLHIIDRYISSYFSILNSPKWLHIIKQASELASVICDI